MKIALPRNQDELMGLQERMDFLLQIGEGQWALLQRLKTICEGYLEHYQEEEQQELKQEELKQEELRQQEMKPQELKQQELK